MDSHHDMVSSEKSIVSTDIPEWTPLQELLQKDPSQLCGTTDVGSSSPRLAKDEAYARAVINSWKDDLASRDINEETVGSPLSYTRKSDGVELSGYLCCPKSIIEKKISKPKLLPAIVMFHTAIGPQDIFLRWKADVLINDLMKYGGCVVFIADLLSDSEGWAWSDRSRYDNVRSSLLEESEGSTTKNRPQLHETLLATLDTIRSVDIVEKSSIAGLGWCFGGYSILEMGQMKQSCIKALVSYHGVFGVKQILNTERTALASQGMIEQRDRKQVLLCNGNDDPFVSKEEVSSCKSLLESDYKCSVEILGFESTKHGFTNPAQDFNPSESFAFNQSAAIESWRRTIDLLKEALYVTT